MPPPSSEALGGLLEVFGFPWRSLEVLGGRWWPPEVFGFLLMSSEVGGVLLMLPVACGGLRGSPEVLGGSRMFPGGSRNGTLAAQCSAWLPTFRGRPGGATYNSLPPSPPLPLLVVVHAGVGGRTRCSPIFLIPLSRIPALRTPTADGNVRTGVVLWDARATSTRARAPARAPPSLSPPPGEDRL